MGSTKLASLHFLPLLIHLTQNKTDSKTLKKDQKQFNTVNLHCIWANLTQNKIDFISLNKDPKIV